MKANKRLYTVTATCLCLACLSLTWPVEPGVRRAEGMGAAGERSQSRNATSVPATPGFILKRTDGAWRYDVETLLHFNPALKDVGLKEGLMRSRMILDTAAHTLIYVDPEGNKHRSFFEVRDGTDTYMDLDINDYTMLRLKPLEGDKLGMTEVRRGHETGGTLFFMR